MYHLSQISFERYPYKNKAIYPGRQNSEDIIITTAEAFSKIALEEKAENIIPHNGNKIHQIFQKENLKIDFLNANATIPIVPIIVIGMSNNSHFVNGPSFIATIVIPNKITTKNKIAYIFQNILKVPFWIYFPILVLNYFALLKLSLLSNVETCQRYVSPKWNTFLIAAIVNE